MKYPEINMTKKCTRSVNRKVQSIVWRMKKNEINREIHYVHWLKYSILFACHFSPNWSIDSIKSHQIPTWFFWVEMGKLILKYIWKYKESRIAEITLNTSKNLEGFILLKYKPYCKATIIVTEWHLYKDGQKDQ